MLPLLSLFSWAGSWQGEWSSETNIEPSVRLTLFDLCATTAVAPYGLLKSDARRMQLLRPACTAGRCYRGAIPLSDWLVTRFCSMLVLLHLPLCIFESSDRSLCLRR